MGGGPRTTKMLQLQATGASSTDDNHPADHCLDGNPNTYWLTTGLYPQELIVSLPSATRISAIHIKCCNVGQVSILHCTDDTPGQFTELIKTDFKSQAGHLQSEQINLKTAVMTRHLKLMITKAFDHFASVHTFNVTAT